MKDPYISEKEVLMGKGGEYVVCTHGSWRIEDSNILEKERQGRLLKGHLPNLIEKWCWNCESSTTGKHKWRFEKLSLAFYSSAYFTVKHVFHCLI